MLGHDTYVYSVSNNESRYTVWTVWISVGVRVRLVDFILQNVAHPYMCQEPKSLPQKASDEQVRNKANASNYSTINDKRSEKGDKNN